MYKYSSRCFHPSRNLVFNGKAVGGNIATTGVWFKNISLDVKVKTNGSKKINSDRFLLCRIKC